jgi:hypothetical protein
MGGNTISMFADLKVILAEGKGRFVANPDSLLLAKVKSMLTAAAKAPAPAASEPEGAEEVEVEEVSATPEVAASAAAEPEEALM